MTTIKKISKWLKHNKVFKIKHDLDIETGTIDFFTSDEKTTNYHIIKIRENGKLFEWKIRLLDTNNKGTVKIPMEHPHSMKIFQRALVLNDERKFGRWMYDETEEEMVFSVNFPLENTLMSRKQFLRINGLMMYNAKNESDEIRTILETGEVPEVDMDMLKQLFSYFVEHHKDEIIDVTADE